MASTYTDAGIELIGIGEQSNTWGLTTNTNWRLMEEMVTGVVQISLNGLTSFNLTTTDGVTSNGRHAIIEFTGAPGAAATVTVNPDDLQKLYFINNATSEPVTITQGSGNSVTVPVGTKKIVYCDGAGGGAAVTDLTENLSLSGEVNVTTLKINSVEVTASASELNTLDGLSASTAELNVLDGITATTTELNKVDGFTGNKDDLNYAKDLRATGVTVTEFDYLDGVTGGIQGQIDSLESDKAEKSTTISAGGGLTGGGSLASNRTISHADTSTQGSVSNSGNTAIQNITLDTYGHVTGLTSKTIEPMPVGATYIQFPGYDAPNTLFGGTWSAIFDNEGIFFRTPGGEATAFGGGIQLDQMQRVTATAFTNQGCAGVFSSFGGAFSGQNFGNEHDGCGGTSSARRLNFDSANSPDAKTSSSTDGETRPRNRTVRVWVRTA